MIWCIHNSQNNINCINLQHLQKLHLWMIHCFMNHFSRHAHIVVFVLLVKDFGPPTSIRGHASVATKCRSGWDQQIAYTWASDRWIMPGISRIVRYRPRPRLRCLRLHRLHFVQRVRCVGLEWHKRHQYLVFIVFMSFCLLHPAALFRLYGGQYFMQRVEYPDFAVPCLKQVQANNNKRYFTMCSIFGLKYSFANQKRISADVSFLRWRSSCWIRTWWILIQSMLTHDTTFVASRTTLRVPAAQQLVVQRIWMTASSTCGTHGCTRRRGVVEVVKGTQPWKHTNTRCLPRDSGRSGCSKQSDRNLLWWFKLYTVYMKCWVFRKMLYWNSMSSVYLQDIYHTL